MKTAKKIMGLLLIGLMGLIGIVCMMFFWIESLPYVIEANQMGDTWFLQNSGAVIFALVIAFITRVAALTFFSIIGRFNELRNVALILTVAGGVLGFVSGLLVIS
jgi:hypothetical protein